MGTITISKPRKTHPYQKSRKSTMNNLVAIALLCFIAFASREVTGLETCDYTCRSDRSCSVNYSKSDSSGSRSGTCNCNSSGNCAYSNCPRCNPNCCAFGVGKTRKTLGGNSGNSGFGNNNGGFGSGNNGGFGSNNGGFGSNNGGFGSNNGGFGSNNGGGFGSNNGGFGNGNRNTGFGSNNGGFGNGNRNPGFGSNNGGSNSNQEEKCSYNCKCDGGCEVSYTGPKTGATLGSCSPPSFGGSCSGTPSRCQRCSNRCNQRGTGPVDIMDGNGNIISGKSSRQQC